MMLNFVFGVPTQSFLRLVVVALLWASAALAVDLGDVFLVKQGTTEGGTDNHATVLQSWLDDTNTLVTAMLQAMPEDSTKVNKDDVVLKDNLAAYFKIRVNKNGGINGQDANTYTSVRSHLSEVDRFLNQQNPTFTGSKKPFLFYNSDWLVETEDVFDDKGNVIKDSTGASANLRTYSPPGFDQIPAGDPIKELFLDMRKGTSPNWDFFAYWSKDKKDYMIESSQNRYKGNPPSFCNPPPGEHMFALTITRMLVDSVTICPDSFDAKKSEPFETIADGIASEAAKKEGSSLQDTSPRGLTLFHELIHLVKDPEKTKDTATKPTDCMALITDGQQAAARVNPDNFVFFAWSYYLSTKGDPQLKWHTGVSSK